MSLSKNLVPKTKTNLVIMAHKHLHELLQEDQEPFLLKNYISDRKSQLQIVPKSSVLQPKKRRPITDSSISKRSLYKQACFFSYKNSPDLRKSPAKSSNAVSLHVPARTAALLLESALRIQKQSPARRPRTHISNLGAGLFSSIFRRLSGKNHTRKFEIGNGEAVVSARKTGGKGKELNGNVASVDDGSAVEMGFSSCCNDDENSGRNCGIWSGGESGRKGEKLKGSVVRVEDGSPIEMGFFSFDCSTSRRASTIWSESNEEKSLDLESSSSTSSRSCGFEEIGQDGPNEDFGFCEKGFCSSPLSPFRFALETSHSFGDRTPVFLSPAASPSRHKIQEREDCEVLLLESMVEEEEEKEQFSPVSVLDPPFEDDDDCNEEGSCDLECSYAIVQSTYGALNFGPTMLIMLDFETRISCGIHLEIDTHEDTFVWLRVISLYHCCNSYLISGCLVIPLISCDPYIGAGAKQQLLHKLRRFEKLAELDPIELEKIMLEEQDDDDMNFEDPDEGRDQEAFDEAESLSSYTETNAHYFVREVLGKLGFQFSGVPAHMDRLVSDLIAEEKIEEDGTDDGESVVRRVCKRLDSWKEEKSNTIHMMVGLDFRRGSDHGWKRTDKNQVIEAAMEIEQSIFRLLVEELSEALMEFSGENS
ncbi:hypothetical protein RHMOL_Rhmol04G0228900 [Rhododendron molle]|uniref:Uncharacterized protein n=1 Tax=Rhododendron molle TaxID=49168 RepID=A0ACC0P3I0_RHOML|nr:hypothetical protein RHMOL_Rhmol04G0228900 [Rhododendron molle]